MLAGLGLVLCTGYAAGASAGAFAPSQKEALVHSVPFCRVPVTVIAVKRQLTASVAQIIHDA